MKITATVTLIFLSFSMHATAQELTLNCNTTSWGNYSQGESLDVAKSYFPTTFTLVLEGSDVHHLEFDIYGKAAMTGNRINIQYTHYNVEDIRNTVKITVLTKTNLMIGNIHFGGYYINLENVRGKCNIS